LLELYNQLGIGEGGLLRAVPISVVVFLVPHGVVGGLLLFLEKLPPPLSELVLNVSPPDVVMQFLVELEWVLEKALAAAHCLRVFVLNCYNIKRERPLGYQY
jgi:hypothetical protein